MSELAFDHAERVIDLGPDAGFQASELVGELPPTVVLPSAANLPGRIAAFQRTCLAIATCAFEPKSPDHIGNSLDVGLCDQW